MKNNIYTVAYYTLSILAVIWGIYTMLINPIMTIGFIPYLTILLECLIPLAAFLVLLFWLFKKSNQ